MDHPDVVVQLDARVASASHRDKPTCKTTTNKQTNKSSFGEKGKWVKKSRLKSCRRRLSEVNNAEDRPRLQPRRVSNIQQVSEPEDALTGNRKSSGSTGEFLSH